MLYWIWLTQIKGIGPSIQRTLLDKFITPENIYRASVPDLLNCKGVGYKMAEKIAWQKSLEKAQRLLEYLKRLDINILTIDDPLYPSHAKRIRETPILLYYKGKLIKNSIGVAIVGSRRCSEYGKRVTINAASFLGKENICVISGMAKGIDGYAHTACLKSGGYTIAMLGHGLDLCYPSEHKELMERIIDNGAVMSEYPPGIRPDVKHFPRRNLLICAWAQKILIVEAGEKSGALITAEYGNKYEREILSVPDNMYRKESIGSNRLIYNGATVFLNEKQLLIENRYSSVSTKEDNISRKDSKDKDFDEIEKAIIELLKEDGDKTVEDISIQLKIDKIKLLEKISLMELEDKVSLKGTVVKVNEAS